MGLGDIFKIGEFKQEISRLQTENENLSQNIQQLQQAAENMRNQLRELNGFQYFEIQKMISELDAEYHEKEKSLKQHYEDLEKSEKDNLNKIILNLNNTISEKEMESKDILDNLNELRLQEAKLLKNVKTQTNKLARSKELVKAINYTFEKYLNYEPSQSTLKFPENDLLELEDISPSVILKLHCMDVKDLRKAYRENDKQIDSVLKKYSARYTTKANQAIYKLMVIALRSELQNILYNLKYEKLDTSIEDIKKVTHKFLIVAGEGNQSIAGTLTKFIGEIEYLS